MFAWHGALLIEEVLSCLNKSWKLEEFTQLSENSKFQLKEIPGEDGVGNGWQHLVCCLSGPSFSQSKLQQAAEPH